MDTLSTSVSTFRIPNFHPQSHEFHHLKNQIPQLPTFISSTTKTKASILSNKNTATSIPHNNNYCISPFVNTAEETFLPLSLKQSSPKPEFHHEAASGYAVALMDVARRNDALEAVERDVKRLSKWLQLSGIMNVGPGVEMTEIVKGVVEMGKFQKHLVKLVRLLVEKNKVGIVSQVLMEFRRIFDELSGTKTSNATNSTQVVLISSGMKMEENQVARIAKRIQKISGAEKV